MSIAGLEHVDVTSFRGPILQPQVEVSDIPTDASLAAENVTYLPGRVQTREGHELLFSPTGGTQYRSMANWIDGIGNRMLSLNGTSVVRRDLSNGSELTLGSVTADRASFQSVGNKMYMGFRNTLGVSAGEARVWNESSFHKIAPAPLSIVPVVTTPNAGSCTAGKHRIGYIMQSLSGSLGRPGPELSGVFSPTVVTIPSGKSITVTLTGTWPTWVSTVWIVMTTTSNQEKFFFVPGAIGAAPPGAIGFPVSVTFDCSDERLELVNKEATDYFFLSTQDASGNGPILPSHLFTYSNRMVYLCGDTAIFSDIQNYESFALDRNAQKLPGSQQMTSGGAIGAVCYLTGPSYTYSIQDTGVGEAPSTWPTPVLVSGSIGTPAPLGFAVNSDYGFAWVAAEAGLYCFDGQYEELPASYYQTPAWNRINWAAAHLVEVTDHTPSQRVFVLAPLDGATSPTHLLVFDYSEGRSPDKIKFSLDNIAGRSMMCQALVRNPTTKRLDIWFSTNHGGAGIVRRYSRSEMQASPGTRYNDMGIAIQSRFHTAVAPTVASARPIKLRHRGVDLRIQGVGMPNLTVRGLDDTKSVPPKTLTLSASPGNLMRKRFHLISPAVKYELESDPVSSNAYFILSGFRSYYSAFL